MSYSKCSSNQLPFPKKLHTYNPIILEAAHPWQVVS